MQIYLTDKGFSSVRKWTYTDMSGVLRMTQVKDCENYPVILLELNGVDPAGIERDTVF